MNLRAPAALTLAGALCLSLSLTRCGAAQPARSEQSPGATSGGEMAGPAPTTASTSSRRERPPRASVTDEQAQPAPPPQGAGATTTVTASGSMQEGGTGGVEYWQGRLDQALATLGGAGGECRDVCRATSDICVAAREICDLTGDGAAAPPQDPRCGRARGACEQATRQRNGSCPVCPGDH